MIDGRIQPPDERHVGNRFSVVSPSCALLDINGERQREVIFGLWVRVIDHPNRPAHNLVWGFAETDGYLGWIDKSALAPPITPSHRVCVARTLAKNTPDLKVTEPMTALSFGSEIKIVDSTGEYIKLELPDVDMWIPARHASPLSENLPDPAGVAELFLGTPYLWGGNSAFGIDCSGLVQLSARACGIPCPGDSAQQADFFGGTALDGAINRNDLFFWKGHVAIALDQNRFVHANAHSMAVAVESITDTIKRIADAGEGPVTARGSFFK